MYELRMAQTKLNMLQQKIQMALQTRAIDFNDYSSLMDDVSDYMMSLDNLIQNYNMLGSTTWGSDRLEAAIEKDAERLLGRIEHTERMLNIMSTGSNLYSGNSFF